MFILDANDADSVGSVHNVGQSKEHTNETTQTQSNAKTVHCKTVGTAFSNSFLRRVAHRVSKHHVSSQSITKEKIDNILALELNKCAEPNQQDQQIEIAKETTASVAHEIEAWSQRSHVPDKAHPSSQSDTLCGERINQETTRSAFRTQLYKSLVELPLVAQLRRGPRPQCNATMETHSTPEVISPFGALYTDEERQQWKQIAAAVMEISNDKIDQVGHLTDEDTQAGKREMERYVTALCEPDIDTVVCQGLAGSGKNLLQCCARLWR